MSICGSIRSDSSREKRHNRLTCSQNAAVVCVLDGFDVNYNGKFAADDLERANAPVTTTWVEVNERSNGDKE